MAVTKRDYDAIATVMRRNKPSSTEDVRAQQHWNATVEQLACYFADRSSVFSPCTFRVACTYTGDE